MKVLRICGLELDFVNATESKLPNYKGEGHDLDIDAESVFLVQQGDGGYRESKPSTAGGQTGFTTYSGGNFIISQS